MAKFPKRIDGGWYSVDVVKTARVDGQLIVYLDPDSVRMNKRHPGYWVNVPWRLAKDIVGAVVGAAWRRLRRS